MTPLPRQLRRQLADYDAARQKQIGRAGGFMREADRNESLTCAELMRAREMRYEGRGNREEQDTLKGESSRE